MAANKAYLSIGDVLTMLRAEFPDVTISKIRFLESQGLVNPERSPSGYRKFYSHDVERLRWVLRQQRENFLPLKVIRDRLARADGAIPTDDLTDEELAGAADDDAADDGRVAAPVVPINRDVAGLGSNGRPGHATADGASTGPYAPSGTSPDEHRDPPVPVGAGVGGSAAGASASGGGPRAGGPGRGPTAGRGPEAVRSEREAPGRARAADRSGRSASHPAAPDPAPAVPEASRSDGARSSAGAQRGAGPAKAAAGADASAAAGDAARAPAGGAGRPPTKTGRETPGPAATRGGAKEAALDDEDFEVTPGLSGVSLTIDELCASCGMDVAEIAALEGFGLIEPMTIAGVMYYDEEALTVARLAAEFAQFGIEARHLRQFRNAVDREVGLVEQVVTPMLRQRNPEARQRAVETVKELARLGQGLRSSLLRRELRRQMGG